jgi:hypothetical protein
MKEQPDLELNEDGEWVDPEGNDEWGFDTREYFDSADKEDQARQWAEETAEQRDEEDWFL